ncbi:MAG: TraB/GumN family protein [Bacteroidetes bacterium]|nr:TraB/GumN family protein [Bacteroidota bacterium]
MKKFVFIIFLAINYVFCNKNPKDDNKDNLNSNLINNPKTINLLKGNDNPLNPDENPPKNKNIDFTKTENKSFLWEISGNGLKDKSYLFGTAHYVPASKF